MYIALSGGRNGGAGEERVRGLVSDISFPCLRPTFISSQVEEAILEHWWLSYMELLHRLQLFTQGNQVSCSVSTVQHIYLRDMLQTVAALGFFIHSLVDCIHVAPSIEGLLSEYILHNIMRAVNFMISNEQCFTLAVKMMKI